MSNFQPNISKHWNKNINKKPLKMTIPLKVSHTNGFKVLTNQTQYYLCKIHIFIIAE